MNKTVKKVFLLIATLVAIFLIWQLVFNENGILRTAYNKIAEGINGQWESKHNGGTVYTNGALRTSLNLSTVSDSGSITETSKETLEIDKLVPAITLRYIRKSNSYKTITTQTSE